MKQDLYQTVVNHILENQDQFYRLAFSYAQKKDDALDIVQNAICKALAHSGALREPRAVKTWFYRILIHESLAFIQKREQETPADPGDEREFPYVEMNYADTGDLFEFINALEPDSREIIKLRFFEELSLREIQEVMGLNLNTIKAKLYRGLKHLKQSVGEEWQ